MKHATNLALALALALGGCAKDEPKTDEALAAPEAPAAEVADEREAAELAPEDPETQPEGVPVPEDFEEEAAQTLHFENLDAELDRLEAEIEAEIEG